MIKLGNWHGYSSHNLFRFHHFHKHSFMWLYNLNNSIKCRAPCNHKHNQDIELLHQYKTLATYLYASISIYLSIDHLCIYCYYNFYGCFVLESTAYIPIRTGKLCSPKLLKINLKRKVALQTSIVGSQLSFYYDEILE